MLTHVITTDFVIFPWLMLTNKKVFIFLSMRITCIPNLALRLSHIYVGAQ